MLNQLCIVQHIILIGLTEVSIQNEDRHQLKHIDDFISLWIFDFEYLVKFFAFISWVQMEHLKCESQKTFFI
jgi:hypothetical protein